MRLPTLRGAERLPLLYATTLLLSALLLFWIQPLFTKMVLPRYGGSPAVWTTASLFFQAALLAGYLYAHLITQKLGLRQQVVLHFMLLAAVFLVVPVTLNESWSPTPASNPIASLLGLLVAGIGLPFFAVGATAPLLQKWFSYTRHTRAADPYFLYSASNIGGLAALIGYPVLLEPLAGLNQQSTLWMYGYALLAILIIACAANTWQQQAAAPAAAPPARAAEHAVGHRQRLLWMLLAFAPSSLLLGVTQHITAEIAAVPLLWLVPLALYVLTFINAFARSPLIRLAWAIRLQPALAIMLALVWVLNNYVAVFALHLAVFFVTALVCHGELARRRPDTAHLTEFYFWLALGGALGGMFNAAAPLLFNSILEYPLAIALACMLRPAARNTGTAISYGDIALPLALAGAFAACIALGFRPLAHGAVVIIIYLQLIGLALYLFHVRPVRFGFGIAVVLLASPILHGQDELLERHRSFFGVHSVLKDNAGEFHVLMHGITIHGSQHLDSARKLEPTTYYHRESPIGQMFSALGSGGRFKRTAAVGLGVGTIACYRQRGQEWTFYEIDPAVVAFARDTRYFHYLANCAPDSQVIVGDGRLSLQKAPDRHFDLIVIDAFSSDSIPVHMITREAIALYVRKLADGGVIIFHITNQYLDLQPVLANLAADAGLAALVPGPRLWLPFGNLLAHMESNWLAMARATKDLTELETQEGWTRALPPPGARVWTDDYSNVLGALK